MRATDGGAAHPGADTSCAAYCRLVLLSGILFAVRASYRMAAMHEERAAAEAAARAQMEDEIRLEHEHEKATETPKEK